MTTHWKQIGKSARRGSWLTLALAASWLAGCSASVAFDPGRSYPTSSQRGARNGPPAHAPAHGYRRNFKYRYWAKQDVYYDLQNRQYVWHENGAWRVGQALPGRFRINHDGGMMMETASPLPWLDREPSQRSHLAGYTGYN